MSKTILVTGVTGQQGGAVARALLGRGHNVRGLTRNTQSEAAVALGGLGVQLVAGDFEDQASIERAASGADAIFVVGTSFEAGVEAEVRQGIAALDAARAAGVGHILYTSVASAHQRTGIPHFESKYAIEQHLASLGVPYTIIAPVYFMDNLRYPWNLNGLRQGVLAQALPPARPLQQIAVKDIGSFAALVLERAAEFSGRRIDIASDQLSNAELAAILTRLSGRPIQALELPLEQLRAQSEDLALMFEWFDRVGYSADIAALRRDYPEVGWQRFEQWAQEQDWSILRQSQVVAGH